MKSVGEAMAIGRTFKESLQKCLRSLEIGRHGLGGDGKPWRIGGEVYGDRDIFPTELIRQKLSSPNAERIFFIRHALRAGFSVEEIFQAHKDRPLVPGPDQRNCGHGRGTGRNRKLNEDDRDLQKRVDYSPCGRTLDTHYGGHAELADEFWLAAPANGWPIKNKPMAKSLLSCIVKKRAMASSLLRF